MKDKFKKRERINHEIRIPQVRLIDEDGNALGVVQLQEALSIAKSRQLDLVEISPNAKPPVCKIVDYGKYNYEKQKKEKLAKKHQSVMQVKEIRFNPNTDTHDLEFKAKHLRHFLMEGHKVKVTVIFRGRMITHSEFGEKLMQDVIAKLDDIGKIESPPKMEGKQLIVYMTPDRNKIKILKEKSPKDIKEEEEN